MTKYLKVTNPRFDTTVGKLYEIIVRNGGASFFDDIGDLRRVRAFTTCGNGIVIDPTPAPECTAHEDVRYVLRITECTSNSRINGSFVREVSKSQGVTGGAGQHNALRLGYAQVVALLKDNKRCTFEVLLAPIKTGREVIKSEPVRRGNNGWAVGQPLVCGLSAVGDLTPGKTYVVTEIDGDGDELVIADDGGSVCAKYGRTRRNEYHAKGE